MPVTPSCTVLDCGILSDPVNGYIQYNNGTTFRSVATYGCDQGYMLTAPPNVECDSTGQWNLSSPPTCEGKHFTHTTNTLCPSLTLQTHWVSFTQTTNTLGILHSNHKHTVCPSLTPQTHCVSFTHTTNTLGILHSNQKTHCVSFTHTTNALCVLLSNHATLCFLYVVSV